MPAHSPQKLFADLGFVVIVPLLMAQKESQQRTAVLCYHCRAAHRTFDRKVAYPLTKFESVVAPSRHFMSDSHAGSIPAVLISTLNNKRLCDRHRQINFKYHDNSGSEVISMNVICTINDKKKKKTYKLEELTPKQREEYGRKISESGMAAMGYVKKQ